MTQLRHFSGESSQTGQFAGACSCGRRQPIPNFLGERYGKNIDIAFRVSIMDHFTRRMQGRLTERSRPSLKL